MRTARDVLAALVLLCLASSACALHTAGLSGRMLLQSGVSCPAQIPACRPRRCTARILDSKETFVCLRCQSGYVPVKGSDGKSVVQCVCPAGTYRWLNPATDSKECRGCPVGSFCPGGNTKARLPTQNIGGNLVNCNVNGTQGLTTKTTNAKSRDECIAQAGYVMPATTGAAAQLCTNSSYAPSNNRLKSCLPCQSGLEKPDWLTGIQSDRLAVCQVPPGRFWELNVVRDCPIGLYREEFVRTHNKSAIACKSCPEGWTTAQIGSGALSKCNVLLPGYKAADVPAGQPNAPGISVTAEDVNFTPYPTELCPIGYYYDGVTNTLGCVKCPMGSTTLSNGSTSVNNCQVPPGYYVSSITNEMVMCPTTPENTTNEGYYRPGWKSMQEVLDTDGKTVCMKCGDGILSSPRDANEMPGADNSSAVPASPASCYILAGWGMTFDPEDFTKFKAIAPCAADTYGVADVTYGLINAPCKACTKNLRAAAGSNSFDSCKNPPGFGYTSEGANQCPDGFWAAPGSMQPCEQCPPGKTTLYDPGNGTLQDSIDDCFPLQGHGLFSGNVSNPWAPGNASGLAAAPCPVGCYGQAGGSSDPGTLCRACPSHSSTSTAGSSVCGACDPGYGKVSATSACTACKIGTFQAGGTDTCSSCPRTTFNDPVGDGYTSYGITFKPGMIAPHACVPRYAQLPKPAGDRLALPNSMFGITVDVSTAGSDNAAVAMCIEQCPADKCCIAEMAKTDSGGFMCKHARLTPIGHSTTDGTAKLFYKLPPSEFAAASINQDDASPQTVTGKTIASGIFAVCNINSWAADVAAGLVGTSPNPELVEAGRGAIEWNSPECHDYESCKQKCMADAACWGFVWHPAAAGGQPGFALRGGESFLGGRSFFVSPDGSNATVDAISAWDATTAAPQQPSVCPADENTPEEAEAPFAGCSGDPPPGLLPNADWGCSAQTASGNKCTANRCAPGHAAAGSITATCTGSTWGSASGSCTGPACSGNPPATLINNTVWNCPSSTPSDGNCTAAVCASGYTLSGALSARCYLGLWQSPLGSCTPSACTSDPPPALIPNAQWNCTSSSNSTPHGGTCTALSCSSLYVSTAPVVASCLFGQWVKQEASGQCIVGQFCPNVPAPSSTCYVRIRPKVYPIVGTNTVINLAEVMLFDAAGMQVPSSVINMTTSTQLKWNNTADLRFPLFLPLNASYCNDGNTSTVQFINGNSTNFGPGQLCHTATAPFNGFWDPCPLLTAAYPCAIGQLSRVEVYNRINTPLSPCSGTCMSRINNFNMDVVMQDQLVTSYSFVNGSSSSMFVIPVSSSAAGK